MTESVVYYLRKGDRIKIGWSGNLSARMRALRPDALLAVEPGCMHLETGRHHQFAEHRLPNTGDGDEWFTPAPELLAHVELIAWVYPTPALADLLPEPPRRRRRSVRVVDVIPDKPRLSPDELAERYQLAEIMVNSKVYLAEVLTELNRRGDTFAELGKQLGIHEATAARWAKPPTEDRRRRRRGEDR